MLQECILYSPAERSRMLLMLIGSFNQQAPPCAPANNKRPCCLLRLINQTNATGGTKHVCKCTWAFLTCLPVYMAGGFKGVHAFVCVCDWGQTCCMDAASEWPYWTLWLHSAFHTSRNAPNCTCGTSIDCTVMWLWWSAWKALSFLKQVLTSSSQSNIVQSEESSTFFFFNNAWQRRDRR